MFFNGHNHLIILLLDFALIALKVTEPFEFKQITRKYEESI